MEMDGITHFEANGDGSVDDRVRRPRWRLWAVPTGAFVTTAPAMALFPSLVNDVNATHFL